MVPDNNIKITDRQQLYHYKITELCSKLVNYTNIKITELCSKLVNYTNIKITELCSKLADYLEATDKKTQYKLTSSGNKGSFRHYVFTGCIAPEWSSC